MKKIINILSLFIFLVFASAGEISAQEFPQSGVLAANGNLPSGSLALPQLPMGLDGRTVPFVASLVRGQDSNWHYSVENKTEQTLKVEFEIAQYDIDLNKISSVNRSFKIKPDSVDRDKVQIHPKAQGAALLLRSWKATPQK